jgi:hypothetical protein
MEKSGGEQMKKIYLAVPLVGLMASTAFAAAPSALENGGGVNTAQYHSYDGLICTDCHTLHASEDGAAVNGGNGWPGGTGGYRELLKKGDWTDMCLSCHKEGYNTSSTADLPGVVDSGWVAPIVMTIDGTMPTDMAMPAGDFWHANDDPKKGHNPAFTKGSMDTPTSLMMAADDVLGSTPPGGVITDGEWSCHSCHGMHSRFSGTYTAYRQLKRKVNNIVTTGNETVSFGVETHGGGSGATAAGYEPIKSNSRGDLRGGLSNTNYVNTRADGQPLDGADLYAVESDTNKNVYRGGFSSFCAACHGDFHGGEGTTKATQNANVRTNGWIKHPTNLKLFGDGLVAKYGVNNPGSGGGYNATMINSTGTSPNPPGYDWKYPLVVNDANTGNVLSTVASATNAATLNGEERIMCLTCHKAHASQYENMTRWDTNAHSFIQDGAIDFTGNPSNGDNPAYGCGKCHQKGGVKAYVKQF